MVWDITEGTHGKGGPLGASRFSSFIRQIIIYLLIYFCTDPGPFFNFFTSLARKIETEVDYFVVWRRQHLTTSLTCKGEPEVVFFWLSMLPTSLHLSRMQERAGDGFFFWLPRPTVSSPPSHAKASWRWLPFGCRHHLHARASRRWFSFRLSTSPAALHLPSMPKMSEVGFCFDSTSTSLARWRWVISDVPHYPHIHLHFLFYFLCWDPSHTLTYLCSVDLLYAPN